MGLLQPHAGYGAGHAGRWLIAGPPGVVARRQELFAHSRLRTEFRAGAPPFDSLKQDRQIWVLTAPFFVCVYRVEKSAVSLSAKLLSCHAGGVFSGHLGMAVSMLDSKFRRIDK